MLITESITKHTYESVIPEWVDSRTLQSKLPFSPDPSRWIQSRHGPYILRSLNIISVYFLKNCHLDLGVRVAYDSSARPGPRLTPSRD
jgi:hypothetical protein